MQWKAHQRLRPNSVGQRVGLVDAYVGETDLHIYLILAERHDNSAASVTHCYEKYARQVCESLAVDPARVVFLELYRDLAHPHAYPYTDSEAIELHRVQPRWQRAATATRRLPMDDGLRELIICSLAHQYALAPSYRHLASWEILGGQRWRSPQARPSSWPLHH